MRFILILAFIALCNCVSFWKATEAHFSYWTSKYNKKYSSDEEYQRKMKIFFDNIERVNQLNLANDGATYAINQFADMSKEEFRNFPCGGPLTSKRLGNKKLNVTMYDRSKIPTLDLPVSWDWTTKGAVTPIKNQGMCGSCWAFSTVGTTEGRWFVKGNPLTSLSEQQQVDCDSTAYGCQGGWPAWALTDTIGSYQGIFDTEVAYPYTGTQGQCSWSAANQGAKVTTYSTVCASEVPAPTSPCTETQMMTLLVTHGPLSACFDATGMQFYQGGIQNPAGCDGQIDHCITIVGYGVQNNVKFWKIKNSWGTGWGEQGFYRLIKGTGVAEGVCEINRVITIDSTV